MREFGPHHHSPLRLVRRGDLASRTPAPQCLKRFFGRYSKSVRHRPTLFVREHKRQRCLGQIYRGQKSSGDRAIRPRRDGGIHTCASAAVFG
jgi:hypothetical protein